MRGDPRPGWFLPLVFGMAWLASAGAENPTNAKLFATYSEVGPLLYQVEPSGEIESVELELASDPAAGYYQWRLPMVSPDQRWVAYTRRNDLWIHDTEYGSSMPITKAGRPSADGWMEVFATAHAWSPDSRYLIYHIGHNSNEGSCNHTGKPAPVPREADYGYYRYDMERGRTLPLEESSVLAHYLMVEHVAWLDEKSFLVKSSAAPDTNEFPVAPRKVRASSLLYEGHRSPSNYFRVSSDGKKFEFVGGVAGNAHQESVSRDGRRLLLHLAARSEKPGIPNWQIWVIDFASATAVEFELNCCKERRHQRPIFSPTQEAIAYTCSIPECEDEACRRRIHTHRLAVNGKIIASCGWSSPRVEWLGDRKIAFSCDHEVQVMDLVRKKVLGRVAKPRREESEF